MNSCVDNVTENVNAAAVISKRFACFCQTDGQVVSVQRTRVGTLMFQSGKLMIAFQTGMNVPIGTLTFQLKSAMLDTDTTYPSV